MVILTNAKYFSNRNVITWSILKSAEDDLSGILAHAVSNCKTISCLSDGGQRLVSLLLLNPYMEDANRLLSCSIYVA